MIDGYKCEKCGKEYSFEEMRDLPKIQAVPEDTNPREQHGYTSVCVKCGFVFHRDNTRLRETISIKVGDKVGKIDVSTVFLGLNHNGDWYETMLFQGEKSEVSFELDYQRRYITKEEALQGHKEIIEKLKHGLFSVEPYSYKIEFTLSTKNEVSNILYKEEPKVDNIKDTHKELLDKDYAKDKLNAKENENG